jgi:predicted Rossmann fold nucleotide-binding protein DprA/Smf involved in DNA uptake
VRGGVCSDAAVQTKNHSKIPQKRQKALQWSHFFSKLLEVDELIRQIGAPPPAVTTILLELELAGMVQRHPGNRVSWR